MPARSRTEVQALLESRCKACQTRKMIGAMLMKPVHSARSNDDLHVSVNCLHFTSEITNVRQLQEHSLTDLVVTTLMSARTGKRSLDEFEVARTS